jgi:PAS domain S-box-containing protein
MSDPSSARILFVEDEAANRNALSWFFRDAGYDVVEAANGQDGLRLAREHHPDLAVLDINLPDMTGFEVCRALKSDPTTETIPVLQVSAFYVGSDYRAEGLESGADGYLVKPFEPRELLAAVRSVLRIHAAEEAARTAAQQWRTTFDAISDGICLIDAHAAILRCNHAFCEQLGRPMEHLLGRPFLHSVQEAFHLDKPPALKALPGHGGREVVELRLGERWFRVTVDPILGKDGAIGGAVQILTDTTERKDLEEQLRQGQKLEAIGRLAGGVAHDFNNLLTAILGNTALIARSAALSTVERELVMTIERASSRAAELTRQLLGFSRKTLLWLAPTNLNEPIREVVGILHRTIDPRIRVEVVHTPDLWLVQADRSQMGQVLMNLCLNACDAMAQGGLLHLEAGNAVITTEHARTHLEARAGEYVWLRVGDTGHGITDDVLPRIFDPFFTTKEPGKGTGLGLAMVFGIVKQHEGWIEVSSRVGEGTTFQIYLPRLREVPAVAPSVPKTTVAPGGSETILVAEDNVMLRDLARTLLRQNGFRVLTSEDGQEAVDVYRREQGRIDLVLLDLNMPRLSGPEALVELRKLNSRVRVLLASGYSDTQPDQMGLPVQGFIGKPYRERDLLAAVRAALDQPLLEGPSARAVPPAQKGTPD